MRQYIGNRVNESYSDFNFRGVNVVIDDRLPSNVSLKAVLKTVEKKIPRVFYSDLEEIRVGNRQEFVDRGINALYKDDVLYITNDQDDFDDI